jgi:hypothetical protein
MRTLSRIFDYLNRKLEEIEMKSFYVFSVAVAFLSPSGPILAKEALPPDVAGFIDRQEGCDHMRGEIPDPDQKERLNEVIAEINQLCAGRDAGL